MLKMRVARRPVEHAQRALDDVVDVGEVALHVAVVEHLDRLALGDGVGEEHRRHVGPSPRPVDREEAQARGVQAVEVAVDVRHQLVRLLGRGVQAHRVVDVVRSRTRAAADSSRRRSSSRRTPGGRGGWRAAALEQVGEADQVGLHVGLRVLERVAHARLRREMQHALRALASRRPGFKHAGVGDVQPAGTRSARA